MYRPLVLALALGTLPLVEANATSPNLSQPAEWPSVRPAPYPGKWTPAAGFRSPIWARLEDNGHMSCLSNDGKECLPLDGTAEALRDAQPLVCASYGADDCGSAFASTFARWQDYSVLGVPYALSETPHGDVMCFSTDGRTCTSISALNMDSRDWLRGAKPVVCGNALLDVERRTGYDAEDHWCATPKIVAGVSGETIAQEPGRLSSMVVPAWSAADEPAVVVRAHLPPGRTLTLVTDILPKDLSRRPAGFEIGALHAIRLDDERLLPPWVMTQRSDQSVHAAFKVTRSGAMCFFDPARDSRHHRVFSAFARLGVSTQIQNLRGHPKILSSPPAGRLEASYLSPDRVNKVTWWLDDQPAADTPFARPARIESLVTVVARKVPDGRGGRRTLPYAKSCDE